MIKLKTYPLSSPISHFRVPNPQSAFTILRRSSGFTIVELLVVIVVIGILAAITIVSYTGISQKAKAVSLQSDLDNASKLIKLFQVTSPTGDYPTANNCSSPGPTEICLKPSSTNTYSYSPLNGANPKTFTLTATNTTTSYRITNDTTPTAVANLNCPTGFIPVPGSVTYGTSDFCVMKYEAKRVGVTNVPISEAAGTPWVSISQITAIANSPNVAGCTGCHLITEAEWMTIAQNVLNVPSNWSTGTVGSGYIYSGHNDVVPNNSLAADISDANGYSGTGQSAPSNQRRTLTLSNGEVIWDFAGNVWEWTSGTVQAPTVQPGVNGADYAWREWTVIAINNHGTLPINPLPTGTGITNAGTWNATNGIGTIYSSSDDMDDLYGFLRGGDWGQAGVLMLHLNSYPSSSTGYIGFRVSR